MSKSSEYNITPQFLLVSFVIIPAITVFIWLGFVTFSNNVKIYCSRPDNQCRITNTNMYGLDLTKTIPLDSIVTARRNDEHFSGHTSSVRVSYTPGHAEFSVVLDVKNNLKSGMDVVTLYEIISPAAREALKMNEDIKNINNFLTNTYQRDFMMVHNRRSVYDRRIVDTAFCAAIVAYFLLILLALIPLKGRRNPLKNFVFAGKKSRHRKKQKHKNDKISQSDFH